jgi:predicted metal-dependent hydrolase
MYKMSSDGKLFSRVSCLTKGGVAVSCALRRITATLAQWILAEPPRLREPQGTNNE